MLNLFSASHKTNSNNDIKLEAMSPEFIPYASHYSPETIITKNGELLQIIKITGFYNDRPGVKPEELTSLIKQAVVENIKNDNFAIWFHTIRRKHSLDPGGDFAPDFSMNLNKAWKARNDWENQYINEVYISVLYDSEAIDIKHAKEMLASAVFPALKGGHDKYLAYAHVALNDAVNGMLKVLKPFSPRRLSIVETKEGCFSEQLRFFGKLLNLVETPMPLPAEDLSEYLSAGRVAFGFNSMEVRARNSKKFGAIFTIKEAREIPGRALDTFLQLPQEFIILQTLDFINSKQVLKEFKRQHYILQASGSEEFAEDIGINDVMEGVTGSDIDFGNSQTTVFLISNSLQQLEQDVFSATEALKKIGVVVTRRDLRMEECFWAQLPGNFNHLSRRKPINTRRGGALAALYSFPAGNRSGNLWGPAVTVFRTISKNPYFFSFHKGNNGNTTILGPLGAGKTVLVNFLVSESRKFNCKLFFFDPMHASKVFIRSLSGFYATINPHEKHNHYAFNPFNMEDTPQNRAFLKQWIIYVAEATGIMTSAPEREHLGKLVDYVCSLPKGQRQLSKMAGHFGGGGVLSLEKRMEPWHSKGVYAHLFDNPDADITGFKENIYGFGLSHVLRDQASLAPVLSYLLYQMEVSLDGTPTMIVLDEAWNLVNNPIFAPGIEAWLDRMKARNAMVIFATENVKNASHSELSSKIADKIATQIFLPDPNAEESSIAYKEVWSLTDKDLKMLASMNKDKRHFMLRQGDVSLIASLDLAGMKELDVLSGSDKTVRIMDEVIAKVGSNQEYWLPAFYERIREMRGALLTIDEKMFIS